MRKEKMKKYVFIDYENTSNIKTLPEIDGSYFLFVGNEQKKNKITLEMALKIQDSGGRFIEIPYTGNNALDMHLAFYMGTVIREFGLSGKNGDFQIYIVSKDGDYDKLINHLKKMFGDNKAFKIKDINEVKSAKPKETKPIVSKPAPQKRIKEFEDGTEENLEKQFKSAKENILKRGKDKRPKTIKSFKNQIKRSKGNSELDEDRIEAILGFFLEEGIIHIEGKKVIYS